MKGPALCRSPYFRYAAQSVCNQSCGTKCFCFYVNLHRIHVLALALTWMKTSEVQSIQLHGIDIKTSEVQSIQMLGIDIKTELSGSKPAINRL